jgi:hypothetical protein
MDRWINGWITCAVRDKVMIYITSVVCANVVCATRQQQAPIGSNKGEFGPDCLLFNIQ